MRSVTAKPNLILVSSEHGFDDFDVDGVPFVHRVCIPHGIQRSRLFNVYCADGRKLGATWVGTVDRSLAAFAASPHYRDMVTDLKSRRFNEVWSRRKYRLRMIAEGRWNHPSLAGACRANYWTPAY